MQQPTCSVCGTPIAFPQGGYSLQNWARRKFCSPRCARRRKKPKPRTPDFVANIRAKAGGDVPTTNQKLHAPDVRGLVEKAGVVPTQFAYHNQHSNIQSGYYENSKGSMHFRSKWEANYALYLDYLVSRKLIRAWEFEVDKFVFEAIKFGTRSYLPDFKIHNNDGTIEYHEVKGYMDSKSKTKLRRMAKYFPEVKLVLVDSVFYRDLVKKLGKVLHFY